MNEISAETLLLRNSERLGDRLEAMNNEVNFWGKATKTKMLFRLAQLGVSKKGTLYKSVKHKILKAGGDLQGVSFSMVRHGVFLERGVGRGRPVGSASANKYKKEWIKPVLDVQLQELADLLAENYADIAAGELRILVPGVIDTKIKL